MPTDAPNLPKWSERIPVAIPKEHLGLGNRLANILDPDIGGLFTFSEDSSETDFAIAQIPFLNSFLPIVLRKDPDEWQATIPQLALAKNILSLTPEEILLILSVIKIGQEECQDLFLPQESL